MRLSAVDCIDVMSIAERRPFSLIICVVLVISSLEPRIRVHVRDCLEVTHRAHDRCSQEGGRKIAMCPMLAFALGAMALAGSGQAYAQSACGPRAAERYVETYVLLVGHPDPPAGSQLSRLSAVDDDVMHMAAFFEPWAPKRTVMLFEPPIALKSALRDAEVRPPTWTSLRTTVAELVDDIRSTPGEKRVYVYYAGHGERYRAGPYARTRLFLAREPEKNGPGYDGILNPNLLAADVLDPLASHATVHFIADACQSWFVLEGRAVSRRSRVFKLHPGSDAGMTQTFARRHPNVGAMLATNGSQSTYEDPSLGGLFSHALRSAAVGLADLDRDGVITYKEMELALGWILAGRAGVSSPGVMGPSEEWDAPFIDLASAVNGAQVCLDPASAGRRELLTANRVPFATVVHGREPIPVVLERDQQWYTRADRGATADWWTFKAEDADLSAIQQRPDTMLTARGASFGELFAEPLSSELSAPVTSPDAAPWRPRDYVALGASFRGQLFVGDGPSTSEQSLGGDLTLRFGTGAHQFGAELGVRSFHGAFNQGAIGLETQVYGLRALYGLVLVDEWAELAIGADLGAGLSRSTTSGYKQSYFGTTPEAALRLMAHLPIPAGERPAIRVDVRGGTLGFMLEESFATHPFIEVGLGFDWELGLE